MVKKISPLIQRFWSDSLYRNSFWLMAGSFSMAGIGFIYWLFAARMYSPTEIGLATTFLSGVALINNFAILGFGQTLIRYLPTSESKEKKINTAFTSVIIASLLLGLLYVIAVPFFTEKLLFIRATLPIALMVILFIPINTLNGVTDSVFTSYRQAHWVFLSNTIQSVTKLLFLLFLPALGVWGIIGSNMIGILIAVVFCFVLIAQLYKVRFRALIDKDTIREMRRYAAGNYLLGIIGNLPGLILPIIITSRISPEQTAYFYMPNMIVSLLTIIPATTARSYFTESAAVDKAVSLKKPILFTYALLTPIILCTVFFGNIVLSFFGKNYSNAGSTYLSLSSVSIFISVVNYFLGTKLLVQHRLRLLVQFNMVVTISYLSLAWLLTSRGINGIALAAILSQLIFVTLLLFSNRNR